MSFRNESKLEFKTRFDSGPDREEIKLGCLQRIADATEAMAKNHVQLQNSLDYYKRAYNDEIESRRRLVRQVNALRGVITKLKKKAAP
jgi:hypothetical protein